MVKRRQQERLYTDDEHNYLRCDIKQDKDVIKGTLFFDKYMKVAKVYALRFGHETELVTTSIKKYEYPNMSYDSRIEDIKYMCEFTVRNSLGGLIIEVVLFSVLEVQKVVYSTKPLGLFVDLATLTILDNLAKKELQGVLKAAGTIDKVYKVINEGA